jgi:hypothetical protein
MSRVKCYFSVSNVEIKDISTEFFKHALFPTLFAVSARGHGAGRGPHEIAAKPSETLDVNYDFSFERRGRDLRGRGGGGRGDRGRGDRGRGRGGGRGRGP